MKDAVIAEGAPKPVGPYSQAIRAGGFVFVSGQLGIDPATGRLEEGLVAQFQRAVSNLREILRAAGSDLDRVVKVTVYIRDISRFGQLNQAYSRLFPEPYPARVVVEVSGLPLGALVELEAVAVL